MTPDLRSDRNTDNRNRLERVIDWYVDFDDEWKAVVISFAIVAVTFLGSRLG